ncbi:damage-inducible protein DinB [Leptospira yasudae]|uniref:DinB family protein n=1 Tax=Leptospira yasudae TaxID=2202201 RepID=UPI001C4F66C8|nr:DinB family protein [Leptospira yasudae]MBW0433367.1 damage-inducible protein DinB [Leptospira yasudae]
MLTPEYCGLMAEYNRWMNEKVYNVCLNLSDAQRKEDRHAFFKSIHSTLNHILWVDMSWMARFHNEPLPKSPAGSDLFTSFEELTRTRKDYDTRIIEWTKTIQSDRLNSPYKFFSIIYQKELEKPIWVLVAHLFNHQTHHRGQITTLLTQMGVDVGVTDLAWMGSV